MSIIKYLLIAAVTALLLFFAVRIISILVPFLIGFLLARTAHALATPLHKLNKKNIALNSKKKKKVELRIYLFLVVIIILAAVYGIFSLLGQAMRAFAALQNYASDFSDTDKIWETLMKQRRSLIQ